MLKTAALFSLSLLGAGCATVDSPSRDAIIGRRIGYDLAPDQRGSYATRCNYAIGSDVAVVIFPAGSICPSFQAFTRGADGAWIAH